MLHIAMASRFEVVVRFITPLIAAAETVIAFARRLTEQFFLLSATLICSYSIGKLAIVTLL